MSFIKRRLISVKRSINYNPHLKKKYLFHNKNFKSLTGLLKHYTQM